MYERSPYDAPITMPPEMPIPPKPNIPVREPVMPKQGGFPQNIDPAHYEQVPVSQDEMYANIVNENRVQNLIAQISPDNQLYEIEMRIKGYKKNVFSGAWEKIDPKAPEPHPTLVSRYVSFISSILNQNTSLSNVDENQINKIMKISIEYLVDDLDANAEMYGLQTDYTERTRIGYMILNVLFMVLNRARNGMESSRMWKALNVTESGSMDQKKGAFDFMKFWQ